MCRTGETLHQLWLIGSTRFRPNAGPTLINHSKNTWPSQTRSKVTTTSAGRSLSSFWLIDDVSRSDTCFHNGINTLSAVFPDHFHFRCDEYEVSPLPLDASRKSQLAPPRVRVFVNVLMRKKVSVWRSLASEKVSRLFLWCMSSGSSRQTVQCYIIKVNFSL